MEIRHYITHVNKALQLDGRICPLLGSHDTIFAPYSGAIIFSMNWIGPNCRHGDRGCGTYGVCIIPPSACLHPPKLTYIEADHHG